MAEPIGIGSTVAGYRLVGMLGRGGMGVVYRAEQPELGRHVAVKLIAPELARDEGFRERFRRESRLAAAIEHPNAIPIYDAGVTGEGVMFLAMRYVEGTDLRTVIAQEGRLEPRRASRIVEQVAGALDEAHARGLVHRDVKPGNVLVSQRRGREHAYLTDFGLTKDIAGASALTATGQWVGTVDYACPEQIEGKRVDARADVYALGCVLFEALTGRVPFERESELAKLFAHANEEPPRVSDVIGGVPGELDDVVMRSLAKDPDERFPSAGDLGRGAAAAAVGQAVAAPERTVAAGAAAPGDGDGAAADTVKGAPPPAPTAPAPTAPAPTEQHQPTVREPEADEGAGPETAAAEAGAARETGVTETGVTEGLELETGRAEPPPPPRTPPRSRRGLARLAAAVGAIVLLAAAVAGAFAFGVIGGDDDGGSAQADFELATPAGAYQVEVPAGWTEEGSVEEPRGPDQFRTRWLSPDREVRLGINRFVGGADRDPEAEAQVAHEGNLARGDQNYEEISRGPVTIGDKQGWEYVFERSVEVLGPSRAYAYFFSAGNDAYRVQGTAADEAGADARELAREVARHAAATLEDIGG